MHKIVHLALRPLFLVLSVTRDGSSSSSVSSARAVLGVVLGLAAAAAEDAVGRRGRRMRRARDFLGGQHAYTGPGDGPGYGPGGGGSGGACLLAAGGRANCEIHNYDYGPPPSGLILDCSF